MAAVTPRSMPGRSITHSRTIDDATLPPPPPPPFPSLPYSFPIAVYFWSPWTGNGTHEQFHRFVNANEASLDPLISS